MSKTGTVTDKKSIKKNSKLSSDKTFSLNSSASEENNVSSKVTDVAPITNIDAILAVQALDPVNVEEQKRKVVNYGNELLDILENLKKALIIGKISKRHLILLKQLISVRPEESGDKHLEKALDDIVLRVKVELAKAKII